MRVVFLTANVEGSIYSKRMASGKFLIVFHTSVLYVPILKKNIKSERKQISFFLKWLAAWRWTVLSADWKIINVHCGVCFAANGCMLTLLNVQILKLVRDNWIWCKTDLQFFDTIYRFCCKSPCGWVQGRHTLFSFLHHIQFKKLKLI